MSIYSKMQFMGKLTGAFLGGIMVGPFGCLLGVFIGNFFDKGLQAHLSQKYPAYSLEKRPQVQQAFIKTISCLMGLIAKADNRVSESELAYAAYIFKALKLNHEQIETAQQWFTTSKNGQVSLEDHIRMLSYIKDMNLNLCKTALDISFKMAKIDHLSPKKVALLNQILSAAGFSKIEPLFNSQDFWQNVHAEYVHRQQTHGNQGYRSSYAPPSSNKPSLQQAFSTLELDITANQTEVKKAYRKLMSKYHPDKIIAKGASEKDLQTATEKTQQISKAYSTICETKGW